MLDLIPKQTIDKFVLSAGTEGLGRLKLIFDAHRCEPVIPVDIIDKGIISSAISSGVFDRKSYENSGILTSNIMQHVAVFSGRDVPEEYLIVDKSVSVDAVYASLGLMFGSGVLVGVSESAIVPHVDDFERLWKLYPARNGRRVGKKDAEKYFKANFKSPEKVDLLERAILNYIEGRGDISARDMIRFMRNDFYMDWIEDAEDTSVGVSYETAVFDCQKNSHFPVSSYYHMKEDGLWYRNT